MSWSELSNLLEVEFPIIQAPIGSATCPELAAAVSNAGGLGTLSVTWRANAEMRHLLERTRRLTNKPFAINLVLENDVEDKLKICLEENVKIISLFWGTSRRHIKTAHQAGAIVLQSVGSVAEAKEAVVVGADAIVVQGWKAGGHIRGQTATFALLPAVVDAVFPKPVIASGGLADGRGIVAALALGASGVWLGTRFLLSREARAHSLYKQNLLAATVDDTVYSTLFDVGWENAPHRTLRNSTVAMWEAAGKPASGERPREGEPIAIQKDEARIVRYSDTIPLPETKGDVEALALYAGQSVGLVAEIKSAAEIVNDLVKETEQTLAKLKL